MKEYKEYNKTLRPCRCGGRVELNGGTYGYPTFYIECLKCHGRWTMDTYSPEEAANKWGTIVLNTDESDKIICLSKEDYECLLEYKSMYENLCK